MTTETELAYLADDNNLALWFTPDAIRGHFDEAVVDSIPEEKLRLIGLSALSDDLLYEEFHRALVSALEEEGIVVP